MIKYVIKRDGRKEDFNSYKIDNAIHKCLDCNNRQLSINIIQSISSAIQSLDKAEALVQGMEEDEANKRYSVDINVKDSNYSIDNTTCKYMNDISAIMDPSKGNSILNCEAMNNTINQINAQKEAIIS